MQTRPPGCGHRSPSSGLWSPFPRRPPSMRTAFLSIPRGCPIREALSRNEAPFLGPVEVDETYIGGKRKNMSKKKRRELKEAGVGRGSVGKTAVVGAKDRGTNLVVARVVQSTDKETLQGFVEEQAAPNAQVYTDEAAAYQGMSNPHEAVRHSVSEYVREMAHTNGMESFWSMLKRGYIGTFPHFSAKHTGRYVAEFSGPPQHAR